MDYHRYGRKPIKATPGAEPRLAKEFKDHYDQCQERETGLNAKDILQLLQLEASKISSVFVVLDALDECTGGGDPAPMITPCNS